MNGKALIEPKSIDEITLSDVLNSVDLSHAQSPIDDKTSLDTPFIEGFSVLKMPICGGIAIIHCRFVARNKPAPVRSEAIEPLHRRAVQSVNGWVIGTHLELSERQKGGEDHQEQGKC